MTKKFYITTAIDYPNGRPHIGHAYEKIVTDAHARWHRYLGEQTYFLTGTDENGQKLQESAKDAGKETQQFVDDNVAQFRELCSKLQISFDDFIRTTEPRHIEVASQVWKKLEEKGDLYFGKYSGQYCLACESFYTETQAPDGICPEHHKPLTKKEEEGYFFKISNYNQWIIDYFKSHPDFIVPRKSYNEILSRLEGEALKDIAFSRPNNGWGIKVPGNDKFVMYTWCDALVNYYSAVIAEGKSELWPADVHVIGKDITWFHSVIWPCMLQSAGIAQPKQIYVHGMVLGEDGRKMSKSVGNVVDPQTMLDRYPVDTFRYYILRAIPALDDGRFSEKELVERHNNELGADLGNLIMRFVKLSLKNMPPEISSEGVTQEIFLDETFKQMKESMDRREHNRALDALWECFHKGNQYVNDKEPWKLKTDPVALKPIIYNLCYLIHAASSLLSPFLPETAEKAISCLGQPMMKFEEIKFGELNYSLTEPAQLFPRIEYNSEGQA
ncbi:MAG: methionine--tRNA ligase [Bdellovibrio sp. CG12_big_fil_rev_8_21_14_0_65_39_13]|nr:MAG: methionine--tRNA ligase [Bdellovibrio sp. CG22_combo_CG10-13_8_21_14_all_39_27]PIQ59824.1 MAG: methionine--tRNA ligase [Bdellovibrio sp. CG12_big_fil_rev_8_21_14_0_65_39_13]PIR36148.1 MAG: methionine--tRNA ligase [Bdellovibrio sp. CG11_big_fil_rev_8_21_14_0_20_39_38]PJB53815.1 MAG: methionine--tRNA ligase [Bdellovibrio sp. CG_4_9_14_3_um_filter_39_7]